MPPTAATSNKLDQLLGQLDDIDVKLDAILAHDELTADQQAEHDRLVADRNKTKAAITREQERAARAEERDQLRAQADRQARTVSTSRRLTDTDAPTPGHDARRDHGGNNIDVKPPNFLKDPKKGFASPREFLTAVMMATLNPGRQLDDRLKALRVVGDDGASLSRQMAAGSDEGRSISDSTAGYLVPEGFSPDVLKLTPEDDPMGPYVTNVPMDLPIVRIPARTDKNHSSSVAGGLTVTRKPETIAGTSSLQTLERVTLEAHGLFGLAYASEEIMTDSPRTFIALLQLGFQQQFVYQFINERISGTGVGEFEGVLKTPCLISVAKEAGQAAASIVYENILAMAARCWGYGNAVWIANHNTLPQLGKLNQQVGTAGTGMIWQASAREGSPNVLLGRPIIFSEYPSTVGTQGDIILGNWSQYLQGTYQPLQSAESMHVRFVNHERAFKFFLRNDGRCWWRTALTPKNGSTLSPFVVLDTRA